MIAARWSCPECEEPRSRDDLAPDVADHCQCGYEFRVDPQTLTADDVLHCCPVCGTEELYLQKDFPERVGAFLVASAVVLATVAWYYHSWFGTFGILFAFGAIDWIFFHTRKDVTVCYRCHAQYRGMAENAEHRAFDLGIGERYRQERIRRDQMRSADV